MSDRNERRLIYAGGAGWSLSCALRMHARMREYVGDVELHVYSSGVVAKPSTDLPQAIWAHQKLQKETAVMLKGPGVTHVADFDGAALAAAMEQAGIWLAPMHNTDVDVCAARLAQLHGAVPVFCPIGPLASEVFAGIPIWGVPYLEKLPFSRFIYESLKLVCNPAAQGIRVPMMERATERYAASPVDPVRLLDAVRGASKIQGWMSHAELAWLAEAAATMHSIAEIGCWRGRSTYAMASVLKDGAFIAAVDHWQGGKDEPQHIRKEATEHDLFMEFRQNIEPVIVTSDYRDLKKIIPIKMPSLEAAEAMAPSDFVFIDGGHGYAEVREDIRAWLPKTKRLIAGHDYDWKSVRDAVRDELGPVEMGPGAIWFKVLEAKETPAPSDTPQARLLKKMQDNGIFVGVGEMANAAD
jgi:hypothetical protein